MEAFEALITEDVMLGNICVPKSLYLDKFAYLYKCNLTSWLFL